MTLEEVFRAAAIRQAKNREGCCASIRHVAKEDRMENDAQRFFKQLFKPVSYGVNDYWWTFPWKYIGDGYRQVDNETRTARVIALCLAAEMAKDESR